MVPQLPLADRGGTAWDYDNVSAVHSFALTTTGSNEVIFLQIANTVLAPTNFRTVASVTGGGLTWAKIAGSNLATGAVSGDIPANQGGLALELWWASAPTPLSAATITITMSGQPSRGRVIFIGVTGCATPGAPYDGAATLPAITAGAYPVTTTLTTSERNALVLMFRVGSAAPGSTESSAPVGGWQQNIAGGFVSGGYLDIYDNVQALPPFAPAPSAPVAFGCDPRTDTSLTATWNPVAPVVYPLHVGESRTFSNTNPGICINIMVALVGTLPGNTVSYRVRYFHTDGSGDGPVDIFGITGTSVVLSGLDEGVDYTWRVRTQDSLGGLSLSSSSDVSCPLGTEPPPATERLAMDDVMVVTEDDLSQNLIWLSASDDRGHSFGNPVSQSIGEIGEYRTSLQWMRLGMARDRVFRLEWSVGAPTALQGCWIEVTPAQS